MHGNPAKYHASENVASVSLCKVERNGKNCTVTIQYLFIANVLPGRILSLLYSKKKLKQSSLTIDGSTSDVVLALLELHL